MGHGHKISMFLLLNEWTHLAIAFDGTLMQLYVNGQLEAEMEPASPQLNLSKPLRIGTGATEGAPYYFFGGSIDEVRIWNTVRTSVEIQGNMKEELIGSEEGLVSYFTFNQGNVNNDNSSFSHLIDRDGRNLGTLNGFALSGNTSNWTHGAPVNHLDSNGNGIGDVCEGQRRQARPFQVEANLGQNYPNPASISTTIPFSLPADAKNSFIQITSINGRVLSRTPIENPNASNLEISIQKLPSGIYFYSLIVDKELIDTKRMSVVHR